MVHEGLLPESVIGHGVGGFASHLHMGVQQGSKFSKYGLPVELNTPEKMQQTFKSRYK
jgi:hypothetical protein